MTVFKSYVSVLFRLLAQNKVYSVFSIGGLAIGFAVVLLVTAFVQHHYSYDKWIKDGESIYRVETSYHPLKLEKNETARTPMPLKNALISMYPTDVVVTQVFEWGNRVKLENNVFYETLSYVDSKFFNVFPLQIKNGTGQLENVSQVLLSEQMAIKYFGSANAVGKVISIDTFGQFSDFEVVGIFKDIPLESHFNLDFVIALDENRKEFGRLAEEWYSSAFYLYLKLADNLDASNVGSSLSEIVSTNVPRRLLSEESIELTLTPLFDIHLHSNKQRERKDNSSINILASYIIAAALTLAIAAINYVSMTTAQVSMRLKEIAVRKVNGANQTQLMIQFLTETFIQSIIALVMAYVLAIVFLPWFALMSGINFTPSALFNLEIVSIVVGFTLITALLSGFYPALVMSRKKPVSIFTHHKQSNQSNSLFRNMLVVTQFAFASILIVCAITVYKQTQYSIDLDTGYAKADRVNIPISIDIQETIFSLRQQLEELPLIERVTFSNHRIPKSGAETETHTLVGQESRGNLVSSFYAVDDNFFDFYNIEPLSGRLFNVARPGHFVPPNDDDGVKGKREVVVTKTFAHKFGFSDLSSIIGAVFVSNRYESTVVGVIGDVHVTSARNETEPLLFFNVPYQYLRNMTVKLEAVEDSQAALRALESVWKQLNPDLPIEYSFIESDYKNLYKQEISLLNALIAFAVIAVCLAAVGLYALASFIVERRNKEIGIRKVLGASVKEICLMITADFSKPVLVGLVLGAVISWFALQEWLLTFAYKIDDLNVFLILVSSLFSIWILATVTALNHIVKAATSRPSESLKFE